MRLKPRGRQFGLPRTICSPGTTGSYLWETAYRYTGYTRWAAKFSLEMSIPIARVPFRETTQAIWERSPNELLASHLETTILPELSTPESHQCKVDFRGVQTMLVYSSIQQKFPVFQITESAFGEVLCFSLKHLHRIVTSSLTPEWCDMIVSRARTASLIYMRSFLMQSVSSRKESL